MLNVVGLAVSYGMHQALSSVDLHVAADEIVVILGANGAGKSTLLKAIAGNCEGKVAGEVTFDGSMISALDPALIVEKGIAFVPEGRGIFGDLSVLENLQLGAYTEHARQLQDENLQRVFTLFPKLRERQKQVARTMSGGEQQMVAIGRALMSAPSILMLDEPSLGLSPLLCKELFSSLEQVRKSGVGILLVEQNAKQSLSIADRGYILENGKITGEDSASRLLHDPSVQAAYLGGAATTRNVVSANKASTAKNAIKTIVISPDTDIPNTAAANELATVQSKPGVKPSADEVPLSFIPGSQARSTVTVPATSLLDESVDDLVARAATTAAAKQTPSIQSASVNFVSTPDDRRKTHSTIDIGGFSNDAAVQQLLTEFETAARNASSGKKPKPGGIQRSIGSRHNSNHITKKMAAASNKPTHIDNDFEHLPAIPVFRNKPVTVYKRNTAGQLKKQERN